MGVGIKELSILELIKTFRTIKRQIKIIKGMELSGEENRKINQAVLELENDLKVFKI